MPAGMVASIERDRAPTGRAVLVTELAATNGRA